MECIERFRGEVTRSDEFSKPTVEKGEREESGPKVVSCQLICELYGPWECYQSINYDGLRVSLSQSRLSCIKLEI